MRETRDPRHAARTRAGRAASWTEAAYWLGYATAYEAGAGAPQAAQRAWAVARRTRRPSDAAFARGLLAASKGVPLGPHKRMPQQRCKLDPGTVADLRRMLPKTGRGAYYRRAAAQLRMSPQAIRDACLGRTWTEI